jgi:Skp family chaperone for outer membrane proteins
MAEVELPKPDELHEHAANSFSRRVALVTAIYAVVLAIAALGGNHAMKEMLLAQQQSSDQWAFYQAKVIREHLYRAQKMRLEVDLAERATAPRADTREKKMEALLKKLDEEEKRYNAEKKDIEKDAKKLEAMRDSFQARDPYFLVAEALLQIAIVMSSVSILARSGLIFSFSLVLAVVGAVLTANGYFMVFHLPFFHSGH